MMIYIVQPFVLELGARKTISIQGCLDGEGSCLVSLYEQYFSHHCTAVLLYCFTGHEYSAINGPYY